jgi:ketopantoate reductase
MGGSGQIAIGRDPLHPDVIRKKLIELFRNAGILIEFHEDVNVEIWKKYIFIAPFALVTATCGPKRLARSRLTPDLPVSSRTS